MPKSAAKPSKKIVMKKRNDIHPKQCNGDISQKKIDLDAAKEAYAHFLQVIQLEEAVTDFDETAALSSELLVQLTSSVHQPVPKLSLIAWQASLGSDWVILDDIPFYSLCEHHFVPFFGTAKIEYRPSESIAGLGGFIRIVDYFSKKPQLQERLTDQIGKALVDQLKPRALRVTLRARQMCVELRGQPAIAFETHFSYENKLLNHD